MRWYKIPVCLSFTDKGLIGLSNCWSMWYKLACRGSVKLESKFLKLTWLEKGRRRLSGIGTTQSGLVMTLIQQSLWRCSNLASYLELSSGCPLNSFTKVLESTDSEAGNIS